MMPQHAVIPYLASVFQEPHLNWHEMQPNELSGARELAGVLIRLCRKDISSTTNSGDVLSTLSLMWDNLEQSVKDLDLETGSESLIAMVYSKRKLLKLSLECFRKLDSLDVNALGPLLKTATDELSRLSRFYTIGISFREVFLLSRDQTPPNHYREGIDILVHHLDDYEKWTATFSYQLAKAWFNKSTLKYYDKIAPINGIVRECYSNQSALLSKYRNANSQTSLCRVSQFSHRMEAIAFCEDYANSVYCASDDHYIFVFGPAVSITVVGDVLSSTLGYSFKSHEVAFVFYGQQYRCPTHRMAVHAYIMQLSLRCCHVIHVFLLTEDHTPYQLMELAPDLNQEDGMGFSPLAAKVGYYLSDARVFSNTYRAIQSKTNASTRRMKAEIDKPSRPPQILSYIFGTNGSVDIRPSKQLNKKALKARATLALTQQMNQEQALEQTQEQTQELSQQQSQVQQCHQEIGDCHFWMNTHTFDGFCHHLQNHAKQKLAAVLDPQGQKPHHTQHHRDMQSRYYDEIAHNETIRVRIAARVFGIAAPTVDDNVCLVSLADYSFDSINTSVARKLTVARELMKGSLPWYDGMNQQRIKECRNVSAEMRQT